ncbi:TonB-dependent receptor [Stenotrophomonas sp. SY1]|uniref:TonB-dependent receptor n=1 Tax=Stenotrophomonas sp. SY1 TaxID=477235 RepID=UPI001E391E0A|nr:TonB-dependent receptor [Stenotrophomonas sp. SY1]MCD9086822.1 TonB-dependent receptor [Stenotrophomonas sp. SY1]
MVRKSVLVVAVTTAVACMAAAPAGAQQNAPDASTVAMAAAGAVELERIEVRPQLEAQTRAVELKRDASAIQDAVASDSMGDYPDMNVAESLQRLPGVSVTRDQGEGRFVVIRGLDAALNSVSIDGIAVGTPEDSSRSAPLDVIPTDSTERLRVIKSATPDMSGDAIGGTVVVESASAFDREGRSIKGKIEASHQQLSGETSPKGAFNYSEVFNDTFGVALGLNYQKRTFESDNTEVAYDSFDGGAEDDLVAVEMQRRKYTIERKRMGANLNLDWRPNEDNSYYLRTLYSQFDDAETRQRTVFGLGDGTISALGDGRYQVDELPSDAISKRMRYRTKEENTFAASLGGENRLANAVLDYRLGYTKTRERVNDEMETRFEYDGDDLSGTIDQNSGIPGLSLSDDGWMDSANYEFDRVVLAPKQVDDSERSAQVNIRFDSDHASYKVGVLGRWRERSVNVDEAELRNGPDVDLTSWNGETLDHRGGPLGQGMSSAAMRRWWATNGGQYSARPQDVAANTMASLEEDYTANEDILAAYAMGTWDIGALRVIGGVRVENTQFDATGNQVDVAADGTTITVTPRTASSSYSNVLPGLHLRYDTNNDWVLRGSLNKSVARPSFGDVSPRLGVNRDDEEVRVGNPQLDPYESTNLDFSFERYLGDSGIVSLGLFHKDIDGYIVQTISNDDAEYPDFEVTRSINGDKAKVFGAEFNWQQQLAFLPGAWSGLLVGASGTWLDTEFDPGISGRQSDDFTLPRASKNVYSAHVGYEWGGFSTRLAGVYRSEYLDSIGDSRAYDIYVAPHTQLDFSLDYKFSKNVSLYLEASNLLDEPLELYQGVRSRTLQNEEYGRTYAIGLKVAL